VDADATPVPFGRWLGDMRRALRGEQDADVPCGSCTACCRAAQFVHIGLDETDALAHVPAALLVAAPGRPGSVVMGFDERGHCPMLGAVGCTIYAHRPRACRMYDCRVYAATGVEPDDPGVAERVRRWRFTTATDDERAAQADLRAAAAARVELSPTRRAVRAIESTAPTSHGQRPG
jgi:Fe-S-cluster containining protein